MTEAEAEETISKNPQRASYYAEPVIKGRFACCAGVPWPQAEEILIKDPRAAYYYTKDIIKGRWPEAEPTISKDPELAYKYALDVIKGRWPEAEKTILKDLAGPDSRCGPAIHGCLTSHWANSYARDVIKGRWLEAEVLLCDVSLVKFCEVKEYVSKIDWASPLNDFPIPKRIKCALKRSSALK